jgi:hypothetical protein
MGLVDFFLDSLATPLSDFGAAIIGGLGVALALGAYYEHARRKERPQALGVGIAAVGCFVWAWARGPAYCAFLVVLAAIVVPWLVWSPRAAGTRAWAKSLIPFTVEIRRRSAVPIPQTERGLLDFKLDGERAMQAATMVLRKMAKAMGQSIKKIRRDTRRMERAREREISTRHAYSLTRRAARHIDRHATTMEALEAEYRAASESMIANFDAQLRHPSGDVRNLRHQLRQWRPLVSESRKNTEGYRDAVQGTRNLNMSRPVNQATEHLVEVLNRIIAVIAETETFFQQVAGRRRRAGGNRS